MIHLADLQAWLQAQLTGKAADEQPNPALGALPQIIKTNGVSPAQRLRVYTSGYYLRLLECLQGDFPVLRAFLSDEVFGVFARGYIYSVGSGSYSLLDFSKNFPAFLVQMTPPAQTEAEWQRYRFPYELACLERLMIEVATDRGFEGRDPRQERLMGNIWMGLSDDLGVEVPKCLRLLEASFDLCAFMDDPQPIAQRQLPLLQKTHLALSRRNYRLFKTNLEHWQYALLDYLQSGCTLHETLEKIQSTGLKSAGELKADLLFFLPYAEEQHLLRLT